MSEPPKRQTIAQFFQSRSTVPQKRPSPESDEDTIVVNTGRDAPTTPRSHRHTPLDRPQTTNVVSTPKLNRSLSIPIRSPVTPLTIKRVDSKPVSSSKLSENRSGPRPERTTKFTFSNAPPSTAKRPPSKQLEIADSDDDDDLPDLSSFVRSKKTSKAPGSIEKNAEFTTSGAVRSFGLHTGSSHAARIRKQNELAEDKRLEQAREQNFTLLMQEEEEDKAYRSIIAAAEAQLAEAARVNDTTDMDQLNREQILQHLQGDENERHDPENKKAVCEALVRTGVLDVERIYSFFGRSGPTRAIPRKQIKFPEQLAALCTAKDSASRTRLIRSSFLVDLAREGRLDDGCIRWLFDSLLTEAIESNKLHHIDVISEVSATWARSGISAEDIQQLFSNIGASVTSLDSVACIEPKTIRQLDTNPHEYQHLLVVLKLMGSICQHLDFSCLAKLCSIMLRLAADERTMRHNLVCQLVEASFDKLVNIDDALIQQHVHHRIREELIQYVKSPQLQIHILSHLPASTPSAAKLRMSLAYNLLFPMDEASRQTYRECSSIAELMVAVQAQPSFSRQHLKTYGKDPETWFDLQARIRILNIAIGDGFRPPAFDLRTDQVDFIMSIDNVLGYFEEIYSSIADTGNIDIPRTDAKTLLGAFKLRLEQEVRSKPLKQKALFDSDFLPGPVKKKSKQKPVFDIDQKRIGSAFMSKYFKSSTRQGSVDSIENG